MYKPVLLFIVIVILTSCQPNRPSADYHINDILLREDFTQTFGWTEGSRMNVAVGIQSEAYRIYTDVDSYVRGFNSTAYDNVVIEVDAIQLTADEHNALGIICRGSTSESSSNGYYFLIGADGSYSIRIGQFNEVQPLIHWDKTDLVNRGNAYNHIRAVCIDDYLALYINGEFVADIRDTKYKSGYIGFTAATRNGETLEVLFDNLIVQSAELVK